MTRRTGSSKGAELCRSLSTDPLYDLALELSSAPGIAGLAKLAVRRGRELLDIDRMALFLYDPDRHVYRGTWGTDERGEITDESTFSSPFLEESSLLEQCFRSGANLVVSEDHALKSWGEVVGRGWNASILLHDRMEPLGYIAADNLLRHRPLDSQQRERLALFGLILSNILLSRTQTNRLESEVQRATAEIRERESRLEKLYAEVSAQNTLKERLFTVIAHDLRGPFGSLRALLEGIVDGSIHVSEAELRELLPEMRNSVVSSHVLLENLLSWVRMQMQEIQPLKARVVASDIMTNAANESQTSLVKAKGLRIELASPEGLTVHCDEQAVTTILRNFLSNALKYSPRGALVRLEADSLPEQELIRFSVRDRGPGIPENRLAMLFKTPLGNSVPGTAGEGGSGLGLLFCSDLARALGGHIAVETKAGEGSCFSLFLPDILDGEIEPALS